MRKPKAIQASGIPVHCAHLRIADVTSLIPNPRNPNKHGDTQVALLAKIIRHQGWRAPITISRRSGFIVTGHGRLEAAKLLQVAEVPVDEQDFATEADEWAHLIADNRIAELADADRAMLRDLAEELDTGAFDMDLTGFDYTALEELMTAAPPQEKDDSPEKSDDGTDQEPIASHIRMVQLFLTTTTHPQFTDDLTKLAARYQTLNITDTVVEAISRQANLNEDASS